MGLDHLASPRIVVFASGAGLLTAFAACANLDGLAGGGQAASGTDAGPSITVDGVRIHPTELALRFTCGGQAEATVTVENVGQTPTSFELSLPKGPVFSVDGALEDKLRADLAPGASRIVTVRATSGAPGDFSADLVAKTATTETALGLRADVRGALLSITPTVADFGRVRLNTTSTPVVFSLTNAGNEPISVSAFTGPGASDFKLPARLDVAPGATATASVTMTPGPEGTPISSELTAAAVGPLCAPSKVTLKGQRVSQGVVVNPSILDFGTPTCRSTPTTQRTVTVSNYQLSTVSYDATLPTDSRFEIVRGQFGTVAKGDGNFVAGTADIVIGMKPTGSFFGEVTDTLTIASVDSGVTERITLHATVTGAAIEVAKNALDVASSTTYASSHIKNVGNAKVCVRYAIPEADRATFFVEADDALLAGEEGDIDVKLRAGVTGAARTTTLTIERADCPSTPSAPLCIDPLTITLKSGPGAP